MAVSPWMAFTSPLHRRLSLYDKTRLPTDQPPAINPFKYIPDGFIHAMIVREAVFCREQAIPLENEYDEDDSRSFHWTIYAVPESIKELPWTYNDGRKLPVGVSTVGAPGAYDTRSAFPEIPESIKHTWKYKGIVPVGTIRLVPALQEEWTHYPPASSLPSTSEGDFIYDGQTPYIKLGRLAVLPEFRKHGLDKVLLGAALEYARTNSVVLDVELGGRKWTGLVLVHAQVGLQKYYEKLGFKKDRRMGNWDEEGIDHVGMWKLLVDVEGR